MGARFDEVGLCWIIFCGCFSSFLHLVEYFLLSLIPELNSDSLIVNIIQLYVLIKDLLHNWPFGLINDFNISCFMLAFLGLLTLLDF